MWGNPAKTRVSLGGIFHGQFMVLPFREASDYINDSKGLASSQTFSDLEGITLFSWNEIISLSVLLAKARTRASGPPRLAFLSTCASGNGLGIFSRSLVTPVRAFDASRTFTTHLHCTQYNLSVVWLALRALNALGELICRHNHVHFGIPTVNLADRFFFLHTHANIRYSVPIAKKIIRVTKQNVLMIHENESKCHEVSWDHRNLFEVTWWQ